METAGKVQQRERIPREAKMQAEVLILRISSNVNPLLLAGQA